MDKSQSKKVTTRIVGPVPRSIKNAKHVEKVYEATRREIEILREAAQDRKPANA